MTDSDGELIPVSVSVPVRQRVLTTGHSGVYRRAELPGRGVMVKKV